MVEVLSFVLSIAGLLATVVLGFTLHFLGVRTRGRQKKEVSSANLRGKSLALTEMQRSQTLVDYGARDDAFILIGKRCDTIGILVVDDSDDTCKFVYGGSKNNAKLNDLYNALKNREIKKVYKPYREDEGVDKP